MGPELLVAAVLFGVLVLYVLTGGADFGGGVWDLLATGPRARAQREAIEKRIGPIWEANHVWLILIIVLMFVCFPKAFAALSIALHIPLTLMLVGIVLRGSSFVFRTYDDRDDAHHERWSRVFAVSSAFTPVMLGICVGAVASGNIRLIDGQVVPEFWTPWLAPFPVAIGFFTLCLFAFLAAVYLADDVSDPALQEDFRRRATLAAIAVFGMAWLALFAARTGAPGIYAGLTRGMALPMHGVTAMVGLACLWSLRHRKSRRARLLAMTEVVLVVAGWGAAQYPYVLVPDLTIAQAAAPPSVTIPTLVILGVGGVFLVPTYLWMLSIFRSG